LIDNRASYPYALPNRREIHRMLPRRTPRVLLVAALPIVLGIAMASAARPQSSPAQPTQVMPDLLAGRKIFERHCGLCHGLDGRGGRGPNLNRPELERAPDDAALKAVIETGIPPEMPEAWFLSEKDVANVAAFVRSLGKVTIEPLPGDIARGERIFASSGCSGCHIVGGQGSGFGPELSDVGARRSPAYLAEAVRNPSSRLPEDFLMVEAVTADRKTVRGIRLNEDTFTIQILEQSGKIRSFRKGNLAALRKLRNETPMPSFAAVLSPGELQDLVAYLASLRGAS